MVELVGLGQWEKPPVTKRSHRNNAAWRASVEQAHAGYPRQHARDNLYVLASCLQDNRN